MKTKTTALAVLILGACFGLAGCAGESDVASAPTPSEHADTNAQACREFGNATLELGTLITTDESEMGGFEVWQERLEAVPDRFDVASLKASGTIAERMETVIENLPDSLSDLAIESDDYSSDVKRVYNACEAGGYPVESFATLS